FPGASDVNLGRVRFRGARDVATWVVVVQNPNVHPPVVVEGVFPPAVDIPFKAAAVRANARVMQPTDIRAPGSEVEPVLMREVEPALERGLLVGLRQSAENVLAVNPEVAGDRVVRLGGFGRLSRGRRRLGEHGPGECAT